MAKKQLVFLIDFDNVLFDTEKLKRYIENRFLKLSQNLLTPKQLWTEYESIKKTYGFADLDKLSKSLSKKFSRLQDHDLKSIFYEINFKKFLIKNSYKFVKKVMKIGRVFIYSLGHPTYQAFKIKRSGFETLLGKNKIIIVNNKLSGLSKIMKGLNTERVVIVDDRVEVLQKALTIQKDSVTIWHKYGMYSEVNSFGIDKISFISNRLENIGIYLEEYIDNIIVGSNYLTVLKTKSLDEKHINQIVKFSKTDKLVKKFTRDSVRFKNKLSLLSWYKKGKFLYRLVDKENNLLGIIWFSPNANKLGLTFAIRLYEKARGLKISEQFFGIVHKHIKRIKSKKLWLTTDIKNGIAIHLYKKLGFKTKKVLKDKLFMTLT